MQFVQETFISQELHTSVKNILSECTIPFDKSQVYNTLDDEKQIVPEIRLSQFRTLTNKNLFDIGDKILNTINNEMQKSKFIIYTNDIMHIKYSSGGYFKMHEDYLSVTSNVVEEYTMIVCVDADCTGGETILTFNKFFKHASKMTNTPAGCLLFRKDIPHEGAELLSGMKEIITYNVWLVKNDVEDVIVVDFKDDNRKYFLSIADIMSHSSDNILKILITTAKEDMFYSKVIQYTDPHTFEEFTVIEKIINGGIVSYHEYAKYYNIIKYYLFDMKNIIMKTIEEKLSQDKKNDVYVGDDFIIFGDSKKHVNFVEDIKKYRLPYISFKIMFVEGSISGGYADEQIIIKMMPVWVSFSENENIVLFDNFMSRSKPEKQSWYSDKSVFTNIANVKIGKKIHLSHPEMDNSVLSIDDDELSEYESDNESTNKIYCDEGESWERYMVHINLVGYNAMFKNTDIIELLSSRDIYEFTMDKYDSFELDTKSALDQNYDNYSIVNNKLVLRERHLAPILDKIQKIKLYESIIAKLNDIAISNTQRSAINKHEHYCNEQVYGNFNLITIYGGLVVN